MSRGRKLRADVADAAIELLRPGEERASGRALARTTRAAVLATLVTANVAGASAVLWLVSVVAPLPPVADAAHTRLVNLAVAMGFIAAAIPIGIVVGTRGLGQIREWLESERPATAAERDLVLSAPRRLFSLQLAVWLCAAVTFGLINSSYASELGVRIAIIVVQTGIVTAALAYLLAERIMRGVAARALANAEPEELRSRGVTSRALMAWAIGSGIASLAVVGNGVLVFLGDDATRHELAVFMVVIGSSGLIIGLFAVTLAARATADPVNSVRRALAQIGQGEFDVRVPVYDGTQLGQLQAGFNRMAEELAERERVRETFGTYVDPDVAAHILEEGPSLAGEEVEVTIMFIDVRDFTGFAERTPPREVVATINALFAKVVPVIHAHGGRVDKYIGDCAMAVFGAPRRQRDHADQALAAALRIDRAVAGERLEVGIGLNSGRVMGGNVGADERLEFSVIGNAVNVAARVESATRQTGDTILLTARTRELLTRDIVAFESRSGVRLKGTSGTVDLFAPARTK